MSLSGGTGGQEKQGLGPRSFDSSESRTGHFLRSDYFAQFLSNYNQALQEKKKITALRKHLRITTNMKGYGIYRMHTE